MSGTKKKPLPDLDTLIEDNPGVDGRQIREAQELLEELRREGVGGPSYGIVSPYERRPFPDDDE